jgi:SAM-dependent methyltransferase
VRNPLNPLIWRARFLVPHTLTVAGVRRYKPRGPAEPSAWDELYTAGELDYYAEPDALARYGILAAYITHVGARSILDVGCGPGLLRPHVGDVGFTRYLGIDPSAVAVEQAKRFEDERTRFSVAERAPPESGSFHVVVCNDMLYYVDDAGAFLDHVRDLLEPDGYVVAAVWRHPGDTVLHRRLDERFDLVDRVLVKQLADQRRSRWLVSCHRRRG